MEERKELPKAERRALQALTALQLYGQRAAVGPLWPRAVDPEKQGTGEGEYVVDDFAAYAGLTAKEAADALGKLRDKSLVTFGYVQGLGVTAQGVLAGQTGSYA